MTEPIRCDHLTPPEHGAGGQITFDRTHLTGLEIVVTLPDWERMDQLAALIEAIKAKQPGMTVDQAINHIFFQGMLELAPEYLAD